MIQKRNIPESKIKIEKSRTYLYFCVLTIVVFFQYITYGTSLQSISVIWDEMMVILLCLLVILNKFLNADLKFKRSPFDKYIISLILVAIISIVINGAELMPAIFGLKNYFLYILLFYAILNIKMEKRDIFLIIKTIIFCFLIQIPIIALQILKAGSGINVDSTYGSFPGANNLSYAALFAVFLYLGIKKFNLTELSSKIIFFTLVAILILGQGRLAFILFPIILFYLLIKNRYNLKIKKFIRLLVILVIIFLLYAVIISGDTLKQINIYSHFTEVEFNVHSGSQRFLYYPYVFKLLSRGGFKNLFFGLGVGQLGSYSAFKYMTPFTRILANYWGQVDLGFDPGVSSEIIPIWGELGFVGIIFFLLLLFKIFKFAIKSYKLFDDDLIRSLSAGLIAGSLLMIVGSFFAQVFEIQVISYPFWLISALLIKAIKLKQQEKSSV